MTAPGLVPIAQAQGPDGGFRRIGKAVLGNIRTYCGVGGETYLWPRWIVLRAIGIVYILLFSGIIREGPALVGPRGIAPIARFIESIAAANPNPFVAFIRAPSLFWISSSPAMMLVVEWAGLGAAVALVLNLWPRLALGVCWSCCLSFVATWGRFSASAVDQVMLETALLAIPYAPAGRRPGLGADSPPRPIALFMMRWLLFRLMFENGIMKLATGDPYWRHFRVMDVLYETAPFPTILGYLDHHLPRAQHVLEMLLTYAAELPVPFLMIVAGRRWRWASLAIWTIFQAGIQLTMNFGWLNTASIALGILILDDQMLAAAARFFLRRLRPYDLVYRFGGEEFLFCLPHADLERARRVLDRLRVLMPRQQWRSPEGRRIPVTVSIGVAALGPKLPPETAIAFADEALYAAKAGGRNRICLAEDRRGQAEPVTSSAIGGSPRSPAERSVR